MTNRKFTSLLKKAEKLSYWDNGYLVTLGYAYKHGIDDPSIECYEILKEIKDEISYRCYNDIPLTATQQEILNR